MTIIFDYPKEHPMILNNFEKYAKVYISHGCITAVQPKHQKKIK